MTKGITPDYTMRAVQTYDQKVKKLKVVLNPDKPEELAIMEAIEEDDTPFSPLVKRLLIAHYYGE